MTPPELKRMRGKGFLRPLRRFQAKLEFGMVAEQLSLFVQFGWPHNLKCKSKALCSRPVGGLVQMLVLVSNPATATPEETTLDFIFESDPMAQGVASAWFGHPLRVRGVLKDGTWVEIGLSMTECVQLHLAMVDDDQLHSWADMLEALNSGGASSAS